MSWLFFAIVGVTIWSATAIADRYFLLKVLSAHFYLLLPTLIQLPLMTPASEWPTVFSYSSSM